MSKSKSKKTKDNDGAIIINENPNTYTDSSSGRSIFISFKELIAADRLEDALEKYKIFLDQFNEQHNFVTLQEGILASLESDNSRGIISLEHYNTSRNNVRNNILDNIDTFRKEMAGEFFEFKSRAEILEKIESRDQVIHELLDIRLTPKRYVRDILDEIQLQKLMREAGMGNSTPVEAEAIRQASSQMTESNWYILHRLRNIDTGTHAVATVIKVPQIDQFTTNYIKCLSSVRHRNVVKILDSETNRFPYYIISEFVYGESLSNALQTVGPRSAPQAADWLYQITEAMEYLRNKRVLHISARPSKIFIDEEWKIMVSPFDLLRHPGVRKEVTDKLLEAEVNFEQTFIRFHEICLYGSPELVQNDGEPLNNIKAMCISDMYSIGLIAYKILTGKDLFFGETIVDIMKKRQEILGNRDILMEQLKPIKQHRGLYKIILKLLEESPEVRGAHFNDSLHSLVREFHPFTITNLNEGDEVWRSYRRCLTYNKHFINDFYENLFKNYPDLKSDFSNLQQKRQSSMLQMAVDLMIDIDNRREYFEKLVGSQNKKHGKYSTKTFENFIDTLIETVKTTEEDFWTDTVKEAWDKVKNDTMDVIRALRQAQSNQAGEQ